MKLSAKNFINNEKRKLFQNFEQEIRFEGKSIVRKGEVLFV